MWEFWDFLRSVERDRAILNITQVQCGRLAFGGIQKSEAKQLIESWTKPLEEPKMKRKKVKPTQQQVAAVFSRLGKFMPHG